MKSKKKIVLAYSGGLDTSIMMQKLFVILQMLGKKLIEKKL